MVWFSQSREKTHYALTDVGVAFLHLGVGERLKRSEAYEINPLWLGANMLEV